METCARRLRIPAISLILAACVLLPAHPTVHAGTPQGARYNPVGNEIFWFIHASDLHIGARGTTDSSRLQWLVTTAKNVIKPEFIVASGDLTDSTNGNLLGIPSQLPLVESVRSPVATTNDGWITLRAVVTSH